MVEDQFLVAVVIIVIIFLLILFSGSEQKQTKGEALDQTPVRANKSPFFKAVIFFIALVGIAVLLIIGGALIEGGDNSADSSNGTPDSGNRTPTSLPSDHNTTVGTDGGMFGSDNLSSTKPYIKSVPKKYPAELVAKNIDPDSIRGLIGFFIEEKMEVGEKYIAEATITQSDNKEILLMGLKAETFKTESIPVSSRMEMSLVDPYENNFKIKPLNSTEQNVNEKRNTVWKWGVEPLTEGENILFMTAKIKVIDKNGTTNYDLTVFDRTIKVESTFGTDLSNFFDQNWKFFTPLVFIPLFMWGRNKLTEYWAKKKNENKPPPIPKPVGFQFGKKNELTNTHDETV